MSDITNVVKPVRPYEIFLVDDDQPILDLTQIYFEMQGYKVVPFQDSRVALDALIRHEPHLAIIDFKMPHIQGVNLYKRAKEVHPHMQVLFRSGIMDGTDVEKLAAELGLTPLNFMAKPYHMDELLRRAKHYCEIGEEHLQQLKEVRQFLNIS